MYPFSPSKPVDPNARLITTKGYLKKNERPRCKEASPRCKLRTIRALRVKKDKRKIAMMIVFRLALQNQLAFYKKTNLIN
jgi:hypothetical protein